MAAQQRNDGATAVTSAGTKNRMSDSSRTIVAIVGSGLVGRAWAITFARGGCDVRLWDTDPSAAERAREIAVQE